MRRVRPFAYLALASLALTCFLPAGKAVPTSTATYTTTSMPTLRINEVLTWNTKTLVGAERPDMIELYNAGTTTIDLSGKSLTDDALLPRKYVFPAGTTLAGGGYLVIYADTATSSPGLHTGFALDSEGDQVRLYDSTANGGGLIDSIEFGFQVPDLSLSRTGPAGNVWALTTPSFGAANNAALLLGTPGEVKINEWAGKITFRLDHDLIELFNTSIQPVAIGGTRLTNDARNPNKFPFPPLSFVGPRSYLPLYGADFVFTFGNGDTLSYFGENSELIDQVNVGSQANDTSSGRSPDGAATIVNFTVPSPGLPNDTALPQMYRMLLANLRITEVMYQPAATSNGSQFEFIELQNIGAAPLDLSGVRFTNGVSYTFANGTTLAGGAFIVICNDRSSFISRYPTAAGSLATGAYSGSLDNTGETLALTLPDPWRVHIVRFRYEPTWYPSTAGNGFSLVPVTPATTAPTDYANRSAWRASALTNGSPGQVDPGTPGLETTARLSNLSVRTALAQNQTLTLGFVVNGGTRNILLRAAGPALTAFSVPGTMANPQLELFNDTTSVFKNDDWPATLADTFTSVGAFPFPPGSPDAAFVQPVDGARSVQARGTGAGIVLVEAYDLGTGLSPRMINVSARNRVGTGTDILVAGFTISGTGAKQLLIRAVGPKLTDFGVPGVLANPKLELYRADGTKLDENDDWPSALAPTFTLVGAFSLDANSRDAALLTTLPPGGYTVQVSGANGETGEALVEIYEVY